MFSSGLFGKAKASGFIKMASGIQSAYGNDDWCARAEQMLCEAFDTPLKAFFVATGTAANCLALSTIAQLWNAVVCHDMAHIAVDENSAPEWFTGGARLLPLATGIAPRHTPQPIRRAAPMRPVHAGEQRG